MRLSVSLIGLCFAVLTVLTEANREEQERKLQAYFKAVDEAEPYLHLSNEILSWVDPTTQAYLMKVMQKLEDEKIVGLQAVIRKTLFGDTSTRRSSIPSNEDSQGYLIPVMPLTKTGAGPPLPPPRIGNKQSLQMFQKNQQGSPTIISSETKIAAQRITESALAGILKKFETIVDIVDHKFKPSMSSGTGFHLLQQVTDAVKSEKVEFKNDPAFELLVQWMSLMSSEDMTNQLSRFFAKQLSQYFKALKLNKKESMKKMEKNVKDQLRAFMTPMLLPEYEDARSLSSDGLYEEVNPPNDGRLTAAKQNSMQP